MLSPFYLHTLLTMCYVAPPAADLPNTGGQAQSIWRLPLDTHADPLLVQIPLPPHLAKPIFTQRADAYPSVLSKGLA